MLRVFLFSKGIVNMNIEEKIEDFSSTPVTLVSEYGRMKSVEYEVVGGRDPRSVKMFWLPSPSFDRE
jgi:hypothetical protein